MTTARLQPMSDKSAAWIRDHAWTVGMRKLFAAAPSSYLNCDCQSGIAYWCQDDQGGQHSRCARGAPLPLWETAVCLSDGVRPAIGVSEVWLADRVCVWRCKCSCHEPPVEPISKPVQLALFGGAA